MELMNLNQPITMSSREIAELTGKEHDNVRRDIKNMAAALSLIFEEKPEPSNGGRPSMVFMLPKRETLILISGYSMEMRARIIDRWQELEQSGKGFSLPQTFAQALKLAADQALMIEQLERTKAEIGSRREATAMNTASQAVKEAKRLTEELDRSKEYATIKRMSLLHHGLEFKWRELKHVSQEMGIPPVDVFDANYGTVKAYHLSVWREAYALDLSGSGAG